MNNQNLFEALINICGFTAIDDEMSSIKDAILKDFLIETNIPEIKPEPIKTKQEIKRTYNEEDSLPF